MNHLFALLIAALVQVSGALVTQAPQPVVHSDRTLQSGHTGRVTALAFMPGGRLISAGADRTLRVWDTATGIQQAVLETSFTGDDYIGALAFDGTGKYLVIASNTAVQLWEFDAQRRVWSVDSRTQTEQVAAFAPDGRSVTVSSMEGDVDLRRLTKEFDVATGRILRTRNEAAPNNAVDPSVVAVSADRALRAAATADSIVLSDFSGRRLHVLTTQGGLGALAFSPDGKLLASGSLGDGDSALKVWDLSAGRELKILDDEREYVLSLAFSPGGRYLAAAGRRVRILDGQTGARIRQLGPDTETVTSLVFSPDGTKLSAAGLSLRMWDVATGASVFTISSRFTQVAFSPDGRLLAAAGMSVPTTIYAAATGQVVRTLPSPPGLPSALQFSPDGSQLALGTRASLRLTTDAKTRRTAMAPVAPNSAAVIVWEVNSGQPMYLIPANDWVSAVAFTPDAHRLTAVFGAVDQPGTVKLWDAQSGQELRTLVERVDAYAAAAFSADRIWLAGGPHDATGTVQLWRLIP